MARSLTGDMLTEIAGKVIRAVFFVEIETTIGFVRVWSGAGQKIWNSETWDGVGTFGGLSVIPETTEVAAAGIELTLSGIPSDLVVAAQDEIKQGLPAKVWLGLLTSAETVIADPYQSFSGRCDALNVEEGGDTSQIRLSVENRLIDLNRARARRYTHQDQQLDYPGDLGFEFVEQLQELNLTWGPTARTVPQR